MRALRAQLVGVLRWTCILMFAVLVLVVLWQVFTRQVVGRPSGWTTTIAQYLFVWLSLFGLTLVFAERGHVAVDILVDRLPEGARRWIGVLVQAGVALFSLAALVWGGLRAVGLSWTQVVPGTPLTIGQVYLALPIAGALIALFALEDLWRLLRDQELTATATLDDGIDTSGGV